MTDQNDRARRLYEEQLGEAAAQRQQELAKTRWVCCGEHRDGPHHEACANWVEPEPTVHDDQGSLL